MRTLSQGAHGRPARRPAPRAPDDHGARRGRAAPRAAALRRCTGVILAGGRNARFGGAPKGLARLGTDRILDRVARSLAGATDHILLAANDPAADAWLPGVERVADRIPGLGALGGLQAAIAHARTPVLAVAWDMPFITTPLLRAIREAGERGARAVLPLGPEGRPEPLCAWYADTLLPRIDALLAAGERRVGALAEMTGAVRLDASVLAPFGDPAWLFANVNTADDLRRAEAHLARERAEEA